MKKQAGNARATKRDGSARPKRRDHGPDGKFVKGNRAKVQTALRAKELPPEMAHLLVQERDDYRQSITDDGGLENIIRRRAQTHENKQRVMRRIRQIDYALDRFGIFDGKGHLRMAWIDKLIALVNTATRIDIALGFERRARQVGAVDDPAEYLAAAAAEQEVTCERG